VVNLSLLFSVLVMELVGGAISFAVGYYALKGYRISSAKGLLLLYFGFLILGISMFLRVITTCYIIALRVSATSAPNLVSVIKFAGLVYTFTQVTSYFLFAVSYAWQTRITEEGKVFLAVFPLLYVSFFNPYLELVALVLLGYVATQAFQFWCWKVILPSFNIRF